MVDSMIEWRPIIIGIIIALILDFLSVITQGLINPAFLLAGIAVGYMVGGTWKKGVINGAIFGLIGAIIATVIIIILFASQYGSDVLGLLAGTMILYFIVEIVTAIVGGALGFFIVAESEKNPIEEPVKE